MRRQQGVEFIRCKVALYYLIQFAVREPPEFYESRGSTAEIRIFIIWFGHSCHSIQRSMLYSSLKSKRGDPELLQRGAPQNKRVNPDVVSLSFGRFTGMSASRLQSEVPRRSVPRTDVEADGRNSTGQLRRNAKGKCSSNSPKKKGWRESSPSAKTVSTGPVNGLLIGSRSKHASNRNSSLEDLPKAKAAGKISVLCY